jgi:hypothetical protein
MVGITGIWRPPIQEVFDSSDGQAMPPMLIHFENFVGADAEKRAPVKQMAYIEIS